VLRIALRATPVRFVFHIGGSDGGGYDRLVVSGFHHVTLNVTDLPRAREFYEGVLGFEVVQDFPGRKLSLRVGESRARLVLCPPPGAPDRDRFSEYRIGLDHVAFGASRADLDRLAAALSVAGVTSDLHHDPVGPAVLSFRDPDNIQLEFFESRSDPASAPGA
jgi:glyoxylase I family protein